MGTYIHVYIAVLYLSEHVASKLFVLLSLV